MERAAPGMHKEIPTPLSAPGVWAGGRTPNPVEFYAPPVSKASVGIRCLHRQRSWAFVPRGQPRVNSTTSSARPRIDCGTKRPSCFAVLRLTTSSNVVGCTTVDQPGFGRRGSCRHRYRPADRPQSGSVVGDQPPDINELMPGVAGGDRITCNCEERGPSFRRRCG
jgi:hypothetical protein